MTEATYLFELGVPFWPRVQLTVTSVLACIYFVYTGVSSLLESDYRGSSAFVAALFFLVVYVRMVRSRVRISSEVVELHYLTRRLVIRSDDVLGFYADGPNRNARVYLRLEGRSRQIPVAMQQRSKSKAITMAKHLNDALPALHV